MLALETTQKRTPGFDDKRLHLLEAAARVFSEVGYDRASMRRIAAEAEVSLAGIYHYVASKEELLYWIQYHTFDSLLRGLDSSLEGVVDPRQRLADGRAQSRPPFRREHARAQGLRPGARDPRRRSL